MTRDRVEYGPRRRRAALSAVGCLVLLLGALRMVGAFGEPADVPGWVAWSVLTLVVLAQVELLRQALRRGPLLVVDDEGFDDRTPLRAGRVAWSQVTAIETERAGTQQLARVEVRDLDSVLAGMSPLSRRVAERTRGRRSPVVVGLSMLAAPAEEVEATMRERWRRATSS